jgi:hypothetical protein
MRGKTMITMMSLATTTNLNMTHTSSRTGTGTGAYVRPRVSGFSRDVGVDADTQCMEAAAAAVAAVRRASGAQVRTNILKANDKK